MARASRWWKVALQVNGPGRNFQFPDWWSEAGGDLDTPAGRRRFAEAYVRAFAQAGYDAIVITDHNSCDWYEQLRGVATEFDIVVFPGCEVTVGSGADGVHLLIVGDPTSQVDVFADFLSSVCGFSSDHPRFDPITGNPLPAPKSIISILEDLPDSFLVIAPHVFNENGLLSCNTIRGSLRWRAFHADRLMAMDVGNPSDADSDSWNDRLRRRELDDYPGLNQMAFVHAPDVYSFDDIANAFTWIRMESPTFEGLRQALLDHEARIKPPWKLPDTTRSPNEVSHAWIERLRIGGEIGVSTCPMDVEFDPHLNVLIGGRGSGKSTVISALRQLYAADDPLPETLATEWESFCQLAFGNANIAADHHLPVSGEVQEVTWEAGQGSLTQTVDELVSGTTYPVTVVSQKELFELTLASDAEDQSISRALLRFVDSTLGIDASKRHIQTSFPARLAQVQSRWRETVRAVRSLESEAAVVPSIQARLGEVDRQVEALEDPELAESVRQARSILNSQESLEDSVDDIRELIDSLNQILDGDSTTEEQPDDPDAADATISEAQEALFRTWANRIDNVRRILLQNIRGALDAGTEDLEAVSAELPASEWHGVVQEARETLSDYSERLESQGVRPGSYQELLDERRDLRRQLAEAEMSASKIPRALQARDEAWSHFKSILDERRELRQDLIARVTSQTDTLKVSYTPEGDLDDWVSTVRDFAGLRVDAYTDEVRELAEWLFGDSDLDTEERARRSDSWSRAVISGDTQQMASELGMRRVWWERLEGLDEDVRIAIAGTVPEDAIGMYFRDARETDAGVGSWQLISEGSPGQRGAAMLSFVLSHGTEPLILDQPEDDLDSEWISQLVVRQLRNARVNRQVILATHNANIPVNGDAERIVVLENTDGCIRIRTDQRDGSLCSGPIENVSVRENIQTIMEGGVTAFVLRELKYNNELSSYRAARGQLASRRSNPEDG